MDSKPSSSQDLSSVDLPSTTESAQKAVPQLRRKGKPAQHRDAEHFRTKKNKQFDKSLQQQLQSVKISESVESLFGQPRYSTARPDVTTLVSVKYVGELVVALKNVLRNACKVLVNDEDSKYLLLVTILQLEAKVWFGQQGSQFAQIGDERSSRAKRVKASLPDAIFPLSYYIEQVGVIEFEGQKIVPTLNIGYNNILEAFPELGIAVLPPGVLELADGNALTGARQWITITNATHLKSIGVLSDAGLFTEAFLANPTAFAWLGSMTFSPPKDVLPTFDELVNRYNAIIGLIKRRVTNAMVPVDYQQSRGTTAQLVTSVVLDGISTLDVWSNRYITDDALTTGGLLHFGLDMADADDSHDRDFRCVETVLEGAGSLQRFVNTLTNRLR